MIQSWKALEFADKEIAVTQNGDVLKFASNDFLMDTEVVLGAVAQIKII